MILITTVKFDLSGLWPGETLTVSPQTQALSHQEVGLGSFVGLGSSVG